MSQDTVTPGAKWEFGADVAACFDDMLARSIPQYAAMRQACLHRGERYVTPGTHIVDLGCSRGAALADFVQRFGPQNRYLGVEVSAPMLAACRERFTLPIRDGWLHAVDLDLRDAYPDVEASLTLCVLTLQFVPIEHRQRILADAFARTRPGGALLLVEKILGADAHTDRAFVDTYYRLKAANGYSRDAIYKKKRSLEGVLVPVTARWNEDLLRAAGFAHVECFWRWMNFAGWLAVKPAAAL